MEIYVASEEIREINVVRGKNRYEIRGGRAGQIVKLKEILETINKEIRESVEQECEVKIEINGSISIGGKAEGGFFGILNLGGSGEKKDSVTISLTTKLTPIS